MLRRRPVVAARALVVAFLLAGPGLLGAPAATAGAADPLDASGLLVSPGAPAPPEVPAASWLVLDLDTGDVLAARSARDPLAPASTLKLLTALALTPAIEPGSTWTAVHEDAAADGSKVGIVPGSVYTVDDLLHGLMLGSGNDAAHALAGMVGGMDAAVRRMQAVADDLGAQDTVVRNTSGLDAPGQVSTAADLAVIGRAVLKDPQLAELVRTTRYRFPGEGTPSDEGRPHFEVANHNRLLYDYEGALGLKNGYTVAAGGSFVGAVERNGDRYLVSLLKAEGSTSQHARDLLDWALTHGDSVAPVTVLAEGYREPTLSQAAEAPAWTAPAADPDAGGEDAVPLWLQVPLTVVALLAAAVVVLRARVLARRRLRARRRRARLSLPVAHGVDGRSNRTADDAQGRHRQGSEHGARRDRHSVRCAASDTRVPRGPAR